MIEVFKMVHGIDKVNLGKLYVDEDRTTKRHVNSNIGLNRKEKILMGAQENL